MLDGYGGVDLVELVRWCWFGGPVVVVGSLMVGKRITSMLSGVGLVRWLGWAWFGGSDGLGTVVVVVPAWWVRCFSG